MPGSDPRPGAELATIDLGWGTTWALAWNGGLVLWVLLMATGLIA